ncbi:MAG: alkyl hydroperoxide reductase [Proteobacteria bacterium SG_bin7]|nr:MAG: alkyl hydroperoxide reductase [Proteobacteria bacterium SG_bin7]
MALTHTPTPDLNFHCPDFSLPAVDGKTYSLADFRKSEVLVVMFICNHCPYVKAIEDRLINLGNHFKSQSVQFVAICSNDAEGYPEDSFENLKKRWTEKKYPFPYLHDQDQRVAKNFGAVCTPDFFVFNKNRGLQYRGRLDDSWKDPSQVTRQELKGAIETILNGKTMPKEQNPSMGCSIKWKD